MPSHSGSDADLIAKMASVLIDAASAQGHAGAEDLEAAGIERADIDRLAKAATALAKRKSTRRVSRFS